MSKREMEEYERIGMVNSISAVARSQLITERRKRIRSGVPAMSSRFTFGTSPIKRRQPTATFCYVRLTMPTRQPADAMLGNARLRGNATLLARQSMRPCAGGKIIPASFRLKTGQEEPTPTTYNGATSKRIGAQFRTELVWRHPGVTLARKGGCRHRPDIRCRHRPDRGVSALTRH